VASAYIGQALFGFVLAYMMLRCSIPVRKIVGSIIIICWLVPEIICGVDVVLHVERRRHRATGLHAIGIPYQTGSSASMISVSMRIRGECCLFVPAFSAALSDVPMELLDAAQVDGANAWRRLRSIIIPLLATTILVDFVLITLGTLNDSRSSSP